MSSFIPFALHGKARCRPPRCCCRGEECSQIRRAALAGEPSTGSRTSSRAGGLRLVRTCRVSLDQRITRVLLIHHGLRATFGTSLPGVSQPIGPLWISLVQLGHSGSPADSLSIQGSVSSASHASVFSSSVPWRAEQSWPVYKACQTCLPSKARTCMSRCLLTHASSRDTDGGLWQAGASV